MPASLGPKPAGCTETLTITMVQQLLFISSSTLRTPTPDHTLTHRTHTPFLHTDTYMIHCLGGRGGKGGGNFFSPPMVHTASSKSGCRAASPSCKYWCWQKKRERTEQETQRENKEAKKETKTFFLSVAVLELLRDSCYQLS